MVDAISIVDAVPLVSELMKPAKTSVRAGRKDFMLLTCFLDPKKFNVAMQGDA
jgi:hypothetical protein